MTAASPFRLGFMLRIPSADERGVSDPVALFRDALALAVAAEDLGFDSLWVTQHHFGAVRFAERGRRLGWLPPSFTPEDFFDREDFHFGHPDEVIERLGRDPGLPHATELLTGMLSARLTPRELLPVMERIAIDVAPALGWRTATS